MSAVTTARERPPTDEGWTVDDLELLPDDDGVRHELVDGCLVVSPLPPNPHNEAATELAALLRPGLHAQWRIIVPGAVVFDNRNCLGPDLLVVRRSAPRVKYAAPADVLLAVEVMSPSSVRTDRVLKPWQFAQAGIPHFWRIEPKDRLLLTYVLDGDAYRESGRFTDKVEVTDPVRLVFDLGELLD